MPSITIIKFFYAKELCAQIEDLSKFFSEVVQATVTRAKEYQYSGFDPHWFAQEISMSNEEMPLLYIEILHGFPNPLHEKPWFSLGQVRNAIEEVCEKYNISVNEVYVQRILTDI